MQKIYVASLFNPTGSEIAIPNGSLQPSEKKYVFFDLDTFSSAFDWLGAFDQGLEAQDFLDGDISDALAYPAILSTQRLADSFQLDLMDRALWNIEVSKFLLAAVRSEILSADLGSFGTSWQEIVVKLQTTTGLVQLGMLNEARGALLQLPTDLYLTTERLSRWASICGAADALN